MDSVADIAMRARKSSRILAKLPTEARNTILMKTASCIEEQVQEILAANALDCEKAQVEVEEGRMASSLFDRLQTSEKGVADMAAKVRAVASLPDPIGRTLAVSELDNDLMLHKVTCPLGVIGVIFESRPDVVPQVGALCLKCLKRRVRQCGINKLRVARFRQSVSSFLYNAVRLGLGEFFIKLLQSVRDYIVAFVGSQKVVVPLKISQFLLRRSRTPLYFIELLRKPQRNLCRAIHSRKEVAFHVLIYDRIDYVGRKDGVRASKPDFHNFGVGLHFDIDTPLECTQQFLPLRWS